MTACSSSTRSSRVWSSGSSRAGQRCAWASCASAGPRSSRSAWPSSWRSSRARPGRTRTGGAARVRPVQPGRARRGLAQPRDPGARAGAGRWRREPASRSASTADTCRSARPPSSRWAGCHGTATRTAGSWTTVVLAPLTDSSRCRPGCRWPTSSASVTCSSGSAPRRGRGRDARPRPAGDARHSRHSNHARNEPRLRPWCVRALSRAAAPTRTTGGWLP